MRKEIQALEEENLISQAAALGLKLLKISSNFASAVLHVLDCATHLSH